MDHIYGPGAESSTSTPSTIMSLTQTITIHHRFTSSQTFIDSPYLKKYDGILNLQPVEVVDLALERLQTAQIILIEWRALLYRRMNVPVLVKVRVYKTEA